MADRLALAGFDWTGTQFRAWAFGDGGQILASFQAAEASALGLPDWSSRVRAHLAEGFGPESTVPVIGCGDAAAAPGSFSKPLLTVPATLAQLSMSLGESGGIHLVPWLSQTAPPDVTCGAETILFGLGEANGSVCIAGSHTRHCVVEHGRLISFSTEITTEMRDLLLSHGTLSLSGAPQQAFDMKVFRDWIERALDTGDTPPVFAVEAALRQGQLHPANKSAALAGLMIGADVAAHYDPGDEVLLVADGPLLEAYGIALDALGAEVVETSAVEALQDGLFELADLAGLLGED